MPAKKTIEIIGVPSDLGANMRGSNMGPAALRIAGLKHKIEDQGYQVIDTGDMMVPIRDSLDEDIQEQKYLQPLVSLCKETAQATCDILDRGSMPLVVGGDHSLAIGSIAGITKHYRSKNQKLGVIWIDAHADINTPDSSPSGNIHGMPLATLLGFGHPDLTNIEPSGPKLDAENVALIGIRTIDDHEKRQLRDSGVNYYSMRSIDEVGMFAVMQEAIEAVSRNSDVIHLSFDIDGIDPRYAPGVSTPVCGGISFREAHLALEMLYETGKLSSMEFVELNPYTDVGAESSNLTVDLILSALGKSIV